MSVNGSSETVLDGIAVLDLSVASVGRIAAMLMGDFGADVIRPGDSDTSPPEAPMWDRNKRLLDADRNSDKVITLAADADVIITTGAGAAEVIDLLGERNPRVVHLSLTRFRVGDEVPDRAADGLMSAATGIGRRQSSSDGGPVEPVFPYLTYEQALWGATCTVAALIERERSGRGQLVTVDGMNAAQITAAATMVVDPDSPPPSTAVGAHGPNPPYSTYRCADGNWLLLGALLPKFQIAAFKLLGVADILTDPRIDGQHTKLYSVENRDWVRARIAEAFATRPCAEWLTALDEVDCPASIVADAGEFLDHPQSVALEQRQVVDDPVVGSVEMPWTPVDLTGSRAQRPRPRQFVDAACWSSGSSNTAPGTGGPSSGGPLTGFRVLDLGAVLAGPLAGSLLADLGADVVKVEPSAGDNFRGIGWHYNRGQRSLALDLRNTAGSKVFRDIVKSSDVVLDNFRPGVLRRLGIDHESLTRVRPDIITGSITGFGEVGPLAGKPGFDPILQAVSGMMAAQGGDADPVFSSIAVNDVTAACAMAFASCLALYHRLRRGVGQRFDVSLTIVAAYMQCGELVRYQSRPPVQLGGLDYPGPSPLDRYYRTLNGYVRVWLPSVDSAIAACLLPAGQSDGQDLAAQIQTTLESLTTDDVVSRVDGAGGAAAEAITYHDLAAEPKILRDHYLGALSRADGKEFFVPARYATFERGRPAEVLGPPGLGEHSRQVLESVGIPCADIDELVESGALWEGSAMTDFAVSLYR
ncbi:CoA transferase [Gordonia sp. ABSL11-1]|uniref:CaiB/BaiF CoA-transferase family protein n=1 Tax=Gordonia sp. ABSL11-1 TaxID=3053924 RepID=UPI0025733B75|nr:CoA transferase [Gordonia sp. ABSL11-1]MDL9948613.1 CoA transferase [Gordonia sp. ABSL11-1]